jgi:hypothetical protein
MSELKVDKVSPRSGTDVSLGDTVGMKNIGHASGAYEYLLKEEHYPLVLHRGITSSERNLFRCNIW